MKNLCNELHSVVSIYQLTKSPSKSLATCTIQIENKITKILRRRMTNNNCTKYILPTHKNKYPLRRGKSKVHLTVAVGKANDIQLVVHTRSMSSFFVFRFFFFSFLCVSMSMPMHKLAFYLHIYICYERRPIFGDSKMTFFTSCFRTGEDRLLMRKNSI